jgi:hypothetical protein
MPRGRRIFRPLKGRRKIRRPLRKSGRNAPASGLSRRPLPPITDSWTRKADLPTGWWASAYTTGNGRLLMSGCVAGGAAISSAVTNEGYSYDPLTDAWQALPNAPAPFYRGAAACGVYRVGGARDHFNSTAVAEELPGYDLCGPSGDVPWLSESTTTFTLAPVKAPR